LDAVGTTKLASDVQAAIAAAVPARSAARLTRDRSDVRDM
jgi:hypothetical protein